MSTSLSGVHIVVDDPDAALAFYRDTLGLTVRNEVANGGFRWITLVTDSQPEVEIVLEQPHAGRSPENGDAVAALLAKGEPIGTSVERMKEDERERCSSRYGPVPDFASYDAPDEAEALRMIDRRFGLFRDTGGMDT